MMARLNAAGYDADVSVYEVRRRILRRRLRGSAAGKSELMLACGGDGTAHGVVQGMAHTPAATLGVVPLGTANALARNLGLPPEPVAALERLLTYRRTAYSAGAGRDCGRKLLLCGDGRVRARWRAGPWSLLPAEKLRFGRAGVLRPCGTAVSDAALAGVRGESTGRAMARSARCAGLR